MLELSREFDLAVFLDGKSSVTYRYDLTIFQSGVKVEHQKLFGPSLRTIFVLLVLAIREVACIAERLK